MTDSLEGTVERITYASEDGYTVLRLKARGHIDLVTVVGHLPQVQPGESLKLSGQWARHAEYGRQFKAERCEQVLPATIEGLKKYLGSGLIKGVGPVTAGRIVKKFGLQTLDVLEEHPEKLREVLGIGAWRAERIATAWEQQKAIKEVMLFLQSHGVNTSLAVKIYKQYGDASISVVKTDPYRLAQDIYGVGFKTADKIARELGLPHDSPARIGAGIAYTLSQLSEDGHVYAPQELLVDEAAQLLEVPVEKVGPEIPRLQAADQVKVETVCYADPKGFENPQGLPLREERAVYLTPMYYGEVGAAKRLKTIMDAPDSGLRAFQAVEWDKAFVYAEAKSGLQLTEQQQQAVRTALTTKVTVLTGGPGTGKTTSLRAILDLCDAKKVSYALCSPTGRAAKRLSEATGRPAKTIHRMLEFSPQDGFKRNADNPLPVNLLVVDEVSMLDVLLANNLFKALPPSAHLLLVGDVDQLPSVGAGDVLRDVINSNRAVVIRLEVIFRQAQDSLIITNAHRINQGQFPLFTKSAQDFFFFVQEDPDQAAELIVDLVQKRIPHKFGLAPQEIMVLSPMHRGAVGVGNLNTLLQAALNPPSPQKDERHFGAITFRAGDRVMQIRNDYDRDVFNGDIGTVTAIDAEEQTLTVSIDGRPVVYDWADNDELVLAYAASVHKAQGAEYPAVVMPLLTQHYMMLQRNLVYTGITRARQLVVIVGSKKALAMAVRNNKIAQRYSGLQARLAK